MRPGGARRLPTLVASALLAACGAGDPPSSPPPAVVVDGSAPNGARAEQAGAHLDETVHERAPAAGVKLEVAPDHVVAREAGCTITVAAIVSFDVFRGGYRTADWIDRLPAGEREMAIGEDHAEAHGRCVLAVRVDGAARFFLEVIGGFLAHDQPSRDECAARRKQVAEHLMIVTEHCADPNGGGALTLAPP